MAIEVIGAGWGRTGTNSLKNALEILGYPCFHMSEILVDNLDGNITCNDEYTRFWIKVADGQAYDFNEIFNSSKTYRATVDGPSCYYIKELMQKYPNAKVILTTRDAEDWYNSAYRTIFQECPDFPDIHPEIKTTLEQKFPLFAEMLSKTAFRNAYNCSFEKSHMMKCFTEHYANILNICPQDKLLVYDIQSGWESLCTFLDKPIPKVSFPRVNDSEFFRQHLERMKIVNLI